MRSGTVAFHMHRHCLRQAVLHQGDRIAMRCFVFFTVNKFQHFSGTHSWLFFQKEATIVLKLLIIICHFFWHKLVAINCFEDTTDQGGWQCHRVWHWTETCLFVSVSWCESKHSESFTRSISAGPRIFGQPLSLVDSSECCHRKECVHSQGPSCHPDDDCVRVPLCLNGCCEYKMNLIWILFYILNTAMNDVYVK